jgi:hypothetical protein
MKLCKIFIVFIFSALFSQKFSVSDPPMIYIYHFVSYDTTSVVFHGGEQNESQNKLLKLPLFNLGNLSTDDNTLISKPLNPKIVSSMVTSSIAKNKHIKIAGESLQKRINSDDFLKIVQSYDYPKRTDFVFLGEINSIGDQYEIDLKLIDVSLQKIVGSKSFNLPFNSLTELRPLIDAVVQPLIDKVVSPFLGYAFLSVDSTSRGKIRWDKISIRPLEVVVNKNLVSTNDSDYEPYFTVPISDDFVNTHKKLLENYKPWSIKYEVKEKIIADYNGYDIQISKLGEQTFKNISPDEKELIIKIYLLSDEEKENLLDENDIFLMRQTRKTWGKRVDDAYLIKSSDGDGSFFQGSYMFRGLLKNNDEPFQVNFTINPGDLNEIHMSLPYISMEKDSDGDGINDKEDACPKLAGVMNDDPDKNGCPEPVLEKLVDIEIDNLWNGLGFELIKIENDFSEIILKGSKIENKINFKRKTYKYLISQDKASIKVLDIPFGLYVFNTFATSSKEKVPGKHYLSLFSESDTLDVISFNQSLNFKINNQERSLGREIIIYFDPFSKNDEEEYKIYIGNSSVPSASVKVAGELHIVGFSTKYNGSIRVTRENYEPAIINIKKGSKKSYHVANLTKKNNANDKISIMKERKDKKLKKIQVSKNRTFFSWFKDFSNFVNKSYSNFLRKF